MKLNVTHAYFVENQSIETTDYATLAIFIELFSVLLSLIFSKVYVKISLCNGFKEFHFIVVAQ